MSAPREFELRESQDIHDVNDSLHGGDQRISSTYSREAEAPHHVASSHRLAFGAIDTNVHVDVNEPPRRLKCYQRWFLKWAFIEMFCTMIFVFLGCATIISVPPMIEDDGTVNDGSLLAIAFAHGFAIVTLVYSSARTSGGHVNPAVTLSALVAGKVKGRQAFMYWIFQLLGGVIGGLGLMAAAPHARWGDLGAQTLAPGTTALQGILWEALMTFALCIVVIATALHVEGNMGKHAPMAIGLTLLICILAGGSYSGASLNPARTFGPAAARSMAGNIPADLWEFHYVYWAGPVIGAIIAGVIGRFALR